MEQQTTATIWRRRISLWGSLLVMLLSISIYWKPFIPFRWISIDWDFLVIMFLMVTPLMEIIGLGPLWMQPIPQRFMCRKIFVWGMRFLFLLVYVGHLFMILAFIMNIFFLS